MDQTRPERRRAMAKVGLVAVLLIATAGAAMSIAGMQSMNAQAVTAAELRQVTPTKLVDVAIEISSAQADRYSGRVLESNGKNTYRRTPTALSFTLGKEAKVIMGSRADLHPGAVVVARGRMQSSVLMDVDRVVVLTGYVQVH